MKRIYILAISILLLFSNCTVSKLFNKTKETEKTETNTKSKEETNIKESFTGYLGVSGSEILAEVNTNSDESDSANSEPQIFENSDMRITFTNGKKGKGRIKAEAKPKKIEISGTRETNTKKGIEEESEKKTKKKEIVEEKKTDNSKFIAALIVLIILIILFARKWIKSKLSIFQKFR